MGEAYMAETVDPMNNAPIVKSGEGNESPNGEVSITRDFFFFCFTSMRTKEGRSARSDLKGPDKRSGEVAEKKGSIQESKVGMHRKDNRQNNMSMINSRPHIAAAAAGAASCRSGGDEGYLVNQSCGARTP
jgi:hypothetical protein